MRSFWFAIGAGALAGLAGGCSSTPSAADPPSIVEVVEQFEGRGMQHQLGGAKLECPEGYAALCSSSAAGGPDSECMCVDRAEAAAAVQRLFRTR